MADKNIEDKRYVPAKYNIYKEGDRVVLEMEMPGVSKDGLEIRVDGDHLLVEGEKKLDAVAGEYRIHEIKDGSYRHVFTIDETIDRNKIEAEIKNGIVTVNLGIRESEKPRKIEIVSR